MKMKSVIRTKTYYCGKNDLEIDLFPWMEVEKRYTRKKKEKVTIPKQKVLNDKRAKRTFCQLVKTNFGEGDLHLTLTYNAKYLPEKVEDAEKEVRNYLRRVARLRKKKNLSSLKYIFITEQGVQSKRIHHHVIINGGLSRDEVELLWRRPKKKGQQQGEALGDCNADRLRTDDKGLERLASYLAKDPKGRKRWTPSQNLKKPEVSVSDTKTSRRKFMQLVLLPEDAEEVRQHFEKQYPDFAVTEVRKEWNEITCTWAVYVKLHRKTEKRDNNAYRTAFRKC